MRSHGKNFKQLSRTSAHRKLMLSNMANSLILHKRIRTTVAKAKALRTYVEPLITKSKTDNTSTRRMVFSYLQNKNAVNELFRDVATKVADRPGGYTRIIKLGTRLGDNAEMAMIELVDYNENLVKEEKPKRTRRTRRGRSSSGSGQTQSQDQGQTEAPAESEEPKTGENEVKDEKPQAGAKEEKKEEPKSEEKSEAKEEKPQAVAKEEKKDKGKDEGEKEG
jgi:large subunit ribosomal protein L17